MKRELTDQELEGIATQLGRPQGQDGVLTAERMAHTNNNMTVHTIEALQIVDHDIILEIGPGNGSHVSTLMNKAGYTRYYGVDISETMVEEANKINKELVNEGAVSFEITNADQLRFSDNFFDKVFTVNTLYFWEDPVAYAAEIRRVLKPGGRCCLAIATKAFMERLPFTKFRFKLYDAAHLEQLLKDAGFSIATLVEQKDLTTSHTGEMVDRDIIIATAIKG